MFSAASISLRSAVHSWIQLGVSSWLRGLQGSGERAVTVPLRQRGAAPLASHAADAAGGRAVVMVFRDPSSLPGIAAPLHGLQLGEWHYVGSLRSMPDRAAPCWVVVVEAATVRVKQLPPLIAVCLADRNTRRGIPAAFTGGQVHIHALPGAWLQDLHPIRAEERQETR